MMHKLLIGALAFQGLIRAAYGQSWNYDQKGADWCGDVNFPLCCGMSQSPVNFVTADVVYDTSLINMYFGPGYFKDIPGKLENNGHTAKFSPDPSFDLSSTRIAGGPLGGSIYQFAQFHFHWGTKRAPGSEHTVDGTRYPMEIHLVHLNIEYATAAEALAQPDGAAVLGFFIDNSGWGDEKAFYKTVRDGLFAVHDLDAEASLTVRLGDLLANAPNPADYFTYSGSLTTPDCNEAVTFMIYKEPTVTHENMPTWFVKLYVDAARTQRLKKNFRLIQPLHDRTVRANFAP